MTVKPRAFWKTLYAIHNGWLPWLGTTYAFVLREALVQEDLGAGEHVTERDSPPGKELAV